MCEWWFCEEYQYAALSGPRDPIELKKVTYIGWDTRFKLFCIHCQPLLLPGSSGSPEAQCRCSIYAHFVERWRCIPCVLLEETRAASNRQPGRVTYSPEVACISRSRGFCRVSQTDHQDSRSCTDGFQEDMCVLGCGRPIAEKPYDICRWCGRVGGYWSDTRSEILARIHAQLGSNDATRSNDPILSQLG